MMKPIKRTCMNVQGVQGALGHGLTLRVYICIHWMKNPVSVILTCVLYNFPSLIIKSRESRCSKVERFVALLLPNSISSHSKTRINYRFPEFS